jgi:glycine cleavage system aminomethyltransferase T
VSNPGPLADRLRQAGATFGLRHGRTVALHFGSAASELAACRGSVGLLDRCDLDVHLARGRSAVIDQLTDVELGAPLPVGALLSTGETWWGRSAPEEVVVVCNAEVSPRLEAQLRAAARRCAGLELQGRPQAPVAIAVIGRAASTLLGDLGAAVPPGPYGQMAQLAVKGVEGSWMLLTEELALALVPAQHAVAAWEAIERAGHALGLIYVGAEAGERFCIAARMHAAQDASCRS